MEDFNRNMLVSCSCGALFGFSWWMMIDILALYPEVASYKHGAFFLPIGLSTLSLILNAFIPNSSLVENFTVTKMIFLHRALFFLSMTIGFGGVLSAIILCSLKDSSNLPIYGLVGIPLLNILILVSNIAFKFAVVDENDFLY